MMVSGLEIDTDRAEYARVAWTGGHNVLCCKLKGGLQWALVLN